MKALWKKYMNAEIYTYVAICVFCASLMLTVGRYWVSVERLISAIGELGRSIAYWFVFVFEDFFESFTGDVPQIHVTLDKLPAVNVNDYLPFTIEELQRKLDAFGEEFWKIENLMDYNIWLINVLYKLCMYGTLLLPIFITFSYVLKDNMLIDKGKPLGSFSKPLERFLELVRRFLRPAYRWLKGFALYVYDHRRFFYTLLILWLLNLNVLTIAAGFFSFYFYYISSFDLAIFPGQILKLLIDSLIMFSGAPLFVWLIIFSVLYTVICFAKGYENLRHMDGRNCGLLKKLAYVLLLIGAPGVGKTTLLTSFCMYFVNIFKKDSLDSLYDIEMSFPAFPFAAFRKELDQRIDSHLIYQVPHCDLYVDQLEEVYNATPAPCVLFGYDMDLFPMDKDVGNRVQTLFGALRTYAKVYLVYRNENPNVSSYPIRHDGRFDDSPYLRLWDGDFYKRKTREFKERSRYAHILDQDVLRMGKRVDPENRNIGCFSYGIWSNSEWGKCRGNQLTTADLDKASEIANQKNDLYAYSHKMARHANTTIDNKVYFRFIGDEQRPESLAADQRDLCDIISITEKSEVKLALPGFGWLDILYEHIYEPFKDFYLDYSNARGDMVLPMFLMKMAVSAFSGVYRWIYNRFGYYSITLMKQKGTAFGNAKDNAEPEYMEYFLTVMQVYSERYNTDCYSGFFTKKQLDCEIGIDDLECYTGLTMTEPQMIAQHDYFLMDIMQMMQEETGVAPSTTTRKAKSRKAEPIQFDVQTF